MRYLQTDKKIPKSFRTKSQFEMHVILSENSWQWKDHLLIFADFSGKGGVSPIVGTTRRANK